MQTMNDALMLLIDNDKFLLDSVLLKTNHVMESAKDDTRVVKGLWSLPTAEITSLADTLKAYVEMMSVDTIHHTQTPRRQIINCMLSHAFATIDWRELAKHYLMKAKEIKQHEIACGVC